MDAESLLASWNPSNPEDYNDALGEFLRAHEAELPLEEICREGIGPVPDAFAEYEDIETTETDSALISEISVSFSEGVSGGCSGNPGSRNCGGRLTFEIDKQTEEWKASIEENERKLEDY